MASRVVATATVRAVRKKLAPTRAALVLTPAAVNRVKEILKGQDNYVGLKIGVKQRGCNGLSYTLDYVDKKDKMDEEVVQDGVRIFIDKKAQLTLLGTEMDYVQNKLSSEFVFNNPNIKGTCGCGESFNI
ncbi:iron-sulfur cluster assembly 1 homolog, mitochondrial [Tribolium castaneum]|uniref:Iron-sulfur cluster assembly 1 homolog, mitochondrial n=1 Tax=Tribolium castaneum TaxID=7070 RepID=D6X3X6_TRICA|nr:PREDICTED: iron-sulfur cluster assembly 1 homolog, mitochondrial [Tribolium castaneum]EEZ97482.1 Iron-sulfur cluster assembly 1 homolog, mitochondrial-like Protein [Tribolium castaneum]|eukprot:XP_968263.1 PREDICTED: iron-sulfur cluster assembly 1 homolog, mitochondrial [Tribolium castaneum]